MRVAALRKVFYTVADLAQKRTIQLDDDERVLSVQASDQAGVYLVFVGVEITNGCASRDPLHQHCFVGGRGVCGVDSPIHHHCKEG